MSSEEGDRVDRAARIVYAINESGIMRKDIATACGVKPSSVTQWCTGETKSLRPEHLYALAKATAFDAEWLATGEGDPRAGSVPAHPVLAWDAPEDLPDQEFVVVPRVTFEFAAGNLACEADGLAEEQGVAFRMSWIRKRGLDPAYLYAVRLIGDSMEPKLPDGAIVTLDLKNKKLTDGGVYAIRYGNELKIKRLFRRYDGGLIIRSDNQAKYPDEHIEQEDFIHVEIIGQYVAHSYDGDI